MKVFINDSRDGFLLGSFGSEIKTFSLGSNCSLGSSVGIISVLKEIFRIPYDHLKVPFRNYCFQTFYFDFLIFNL